METRPLATAPPAETLTAAPGVATAPGAAGPGVPVATTPRVAGLPRWTWWHTLSLVVITLALALPGLLAQPWLATSGLPTTSWPVGLLAAPGGRLLVWVATALPLLGLLVLVGHGIVGRWPGALIDGRNRISLARLQMATWTVLVLSAFFTTVLWRIAAAEPDALNVAIPYELWLAMGLSITSLVAAPLILHTKTGKAPNGQELDQTLALREVQGASSAQGGQEGAQGQLLVKARPQAADWSDLFQGEETGNAAQLDLGKVQMFFFTVVLALTYAAALAAAFTTIAPALPTGLPPLQPSAVALLGLSHAGYLVNKALPHSLTSATT